MNENQTDLSQLDNSIVPLLAVDCLITPAALAAELVGPLEFAMAG